MPVYALCDANNFYCSCERVFNPRLRGCRLSCSRTMTAAASRGARIMWNLFRCQILSTLQELIGLDGQEIVRDLMLGICPATVGDAVLRQCRTVFRCQRPRFRLEQCADHVCFCHRGFVAAVASLIQTKTGQTLLD